MADTPYVRERAEGVVEKPGEAWVAETPLRAGAIGLAGAVMQNVTHIAPAIAAFFFTATIVGFSGAHAPLAYLIGFLVVLALGSCLVQLARRFPSAGGYFTYVSRTVSPQAGFLTGWIYALYSPIVTGPICAFLGFILEGELQANYGWTWFHWWMFVIVALPAIAALAYFGIKLSVRTIVVVGALEFLIVLALGISGLISPGNGGFTLRAFDYGFNPGGIATASGFALAIVFTVQGLTGWEAAAPLAEETENPRRNIPRAIMASIAIIGVMLILVIWGQIIGWGVNDLSKLTSSPELPALVIAHRLWGGLWFLALLAMFTSVIGASLACQNVATRMWYRMGRSGVLPSALGTVHPTHRTPTVAIYVQLALSVLLGLGAAALWGPDKIFVLSVGFVLVIGVIFVYVLANVGVVLYYWRERRDEFNWILHFVFPVGTSVVLIYSLYASFNPFPAFPYSLSPFIVLAWLVIGVVVLLVLRARGDAWLARASEIVEERRETPEELAHRTAL
ncbi:MAG TPA: APC family permease [Candidatus Limnocylindrales bacterium]|nr:APC family permease [Candidatus Limnocylindrales bacterium]